MNWTVVRTSAVGELRDGVVESLAEPGDARDAPCRSKIAVRISWITACRSSTQFDKALLHFGRPRPRDRALQRQADGEQSLDHVVVQVACDAVAVGQDVEFPQMALSGGQLPGQRSLVGERGEHVELFVVELLLAFVAQRHQHPGDGLGGA